jgi:hypothetical protein
MATHRLRSHAVSAKDHGGFDINDAALACRRTVRLASLFVPSHLKLVRPIGMGRGLAASPLPHHRAYGSRIRRCGRLSQGETSPQPERSSLSVPAASASQRPSIARPLVGCPLAVPPQAATPLDRAGLRLAHVAAPPLSFPAFQPWDASRASPAPDLRCRLLTSARRSGRMPPPAIPCQDIPQISRGQRSYRQCLDAGLITYALWWMEDFVVACLLVLSVPHLVSGFESLATHRRLTRPLDPTSR